MRIAVILAAALGATACVGDKAELGGVTNRLEAPADARACNMDKLKTIKGGAFRVSGDVLWFYAARQQKASLNSMNVRYDVTADGVPVNITYAGPAADTRHATKQMLIRAAVEAIEGTRYEWIGPAAYSTGCQRDMHFFVNIEDDGPG